MSTGAPLSRCFLWCYVNDIFKSLLTWVVEFLVSENGNSEVLTLNGAHGTCASFAQKINTSGFSVVTDCGRAGKGVYFWSYSSYPHLAKKLAFLWWGYALKSSAYRNATDKGCAVVFAEITVNKDSYLDFNDPDIEDALNVAVAQAREGGNPNEPIQPTTLHSIYEYVVTSLEEASGCSFDVIRARVPAPPKSDFVEKIYIGNPNCYVVRRGVDRIKLVDVEIL